MVKVCCPALDKKAEKSKFDFETIPVYIKTSKQNKSATPVLCIFVYRTVWYIAREIQW